MFEGIVINKGLAINKTFVKKINNIKIEYRAISNIEREIEKLEKAKEIVAKELEEKRDKTLKFLGEEEANIYATYLKTLNTSILVGQVKKDIEEQAANAEFILNKIRKKYVKIYSRVDDLFLKKKSDSLQYVIRMLILRIMDFDTNNLTNIVSERILVSKSISKNDYLNLVNKDIKGIILEDANKCAYAKILGESMRIPVIVGVKDATNKIDSEQNLILDCTGLGAIVLEPSDDELNIYEKMLQFSSNIQETDDFLKEIMDSEDRRLVSLIYNANELESDLDLDVGLVETEFSYIGKSEVPSFDTLLADYEAIYNSSKMSSNIVFRALSLSSEHDVPFIYRGEEKNPIMGLRGSKWLLAQRKLMVEHLAAIIKASKDKEVNIAFSNISSRKQILEIKVVLEEARMLADVDEDKRVRIGVYVDNPSSALLIKVYSDDVEFIIIDSTILTEFLKGVDKNNVYANEEYDVLCPTVLKFIFDAITSAHEEGIFVSITGDITRDTKNFPILLGMGVDQIIVDERYTNAWWYVYKTDVRVWNKVAKRCMEQTSSYSVSMIINEEITKMLEL